MRHGGEAVLNESAKRSPEVADQQVVGSGCGRAGAGVGSAPRHSSSTTGYSSCFASPEFWSAMMPPVGWAPDQLTSTSWYPRRFLVSLTDSEKSRESTTTSWPPTRGARVTGFEPWNGTVVVVVLDARDGPARVIAVARRSRPTDAA